MSTLSLDRTGHPPCPDRPPHGTPAPVPLPDAPAVSPLRRLVRRLALALLVWSTRPATAGRATARALHAESALRAERLHGLDRRIL